MEGMDAGRKLAAAGRLRATAGEPVLRVRGGAVRRTARGTASLIQPERGGRVKGAPSARRFGSGGTGLTCVGGGGGLTAETPCDPDHPPLVPQRTAY